MKNGIVCIHSYVGSAWNRHKQTNKQNSHLASHWLIYPPINERGNWKMDHLKMYFLLKMAISYCHV